MYIGESYKDSVIYDVKESDWFNDFIIPAGLPTETIRVFMVDYKNIDNKKEVELITHEY